MIFVHRDLSPDRLRGIVGRMTYSVDIDDLLVAGTDVGFGRHRRGVTLNAEPAASSLPIRRPTRSLK